MSGFILIHRGWMQSDVFSDDPLSEREAWLWLIEKAAWKACIRSNAKGERISIERGQFHTSLRNLEQAWGWGKNKVARFLERLEQHEMIGAASGQSGSIITICNDEKYQETRDSQNNNIGTVAGQSRDTQEQGKQPSEDKSSSENIGARDPFSVCPPGCETEHWRDFCSNRKSKRLARTNTAYAGILRDLAKFADSEWPPGRILQHAAERGWGAIFDPRKSFNGSNHVRSQGFQRSEPDGLGRTARAAIEVFGPPDDAVAH